MAAEMLLVLTNRLIWESSCHYHTWLLPGACDWLVLQETCYAVKLVTAVTGTAFRQQEEKSCWVTLLPSLL